MGRIWRIHLHREASCRRGAAPRACWGRPVGIGEGRSPSPTYIDSPCFQTTATLLMIAHVNIILYKFYYLSSSSSPLQAQQPLLSESQQFLSSLSSHVFSYNIEGVTKCFRASSLVCSYWEKGRGSQELGKYSLQCDDESSPSHSTSSTHLHSSFTSHGSFSPSHNCSSPSLSSHVFKHDAEGENHYNALGQKN